MSDGWIRLHRKILNWGWYTDINTSRLFIHLLLKANHKSNHWRGHQIDRGSCITSLRHLSNETGLSIMQIRTAINKLKSTGELTIETTSQFSYITMNNYNEYQQGNRLPNKRITHEQHTSNTRVTTNKNDKKDNNIKINNIYMSFKEKINSNSRLTKQAKLKLRTRLKSFTEKELLKAIDNFSKNNWWVEKNSGRGIAWFFHSDDRIDQFLCLKPEKRMEVVRL